MTQVSVGEPEMVTSVVSTEVMVVKAVMKETPLLEPPTLPVWGEVLTTG